MKKIGPIISVRLEEDLLINVYDKLKNF
jgi:hypothetical protein